MIARIWRGAVRRKDAAAYAEYMQSTGVAGYTRTPGNRGVWMLRRDAGDTTEFLMFTLWDSLDAVKAFAGEDYEAAVFYPEDERFLVEADRTTTHYTVDTHAAASGDVSELRVVLTVADFQEAVRFYGDALGLRQLADWSTEDGRVVAFEAGRGTLELFDEAQAATVDAIEAGRRVSGPVRLALEVADSDEAAQRLVAAGAEQVARPVTTPWGDRNARVRTPDGMQLTLFSPEQRPAR